MVKTLCDVCQKEIKSGAGCLDSGFHTRRVIMKMVGTSFTAGEESVLSLPIRLKQDSSEKPNDLCDACVLEIAKKYVEELEKKPDEDIPF